MTLIYGVATQDIGFMVADTRLTYKAEENKGPVGARGEWHALKIQILNPHIAIAFSGHVSTSLKLIHNIAEELSCNPNMIIETRLFEL